MKVATSSDPAARARAVRDAMPEGGLFHGKGFRIAPHPFPLPPQVAEELDKLGYRLARFMRACNELYHASLAGRVPPWVAGLLDHGKPDHLMRLMRERRLRNVLPAVIRPDLILTHEGYAISELDSVPGGIGLTGWMNRTYARLGSRVLGGEDGMLDGFESIFPCGDIVVSNEAGDYRPEMQWLAGELNQRANETTRWRVVGGDHVPDGRPVYRFFELFDLPNVPCAAALMEAVKSKPELVTPPFKSFLEEKILFALFWLGPLQTFWVRELGSRTFEALRKVIPYSWMVSPEPLPPHAVLPRLEVNGWDEVKAFSKSRRNLILKVSGFSERAWGGRGVRVGHDLSQPQWAAALDEALRDFPGQPHVLQEFRQGDLFRHACLENNNDLVEMTGRVRLCPYYFVADGKTRLGGALATLCPADKKLLHGMEDAILVPAVAPASCR